MHVVATILWRRLDTPGHDACRLEQHCDGWALDGAAAFLDEHQRVCRLAYRVRCDEQWHTSSGKVQGFVGDGVVDIELARVDGHWTNNGVVVAALDDVTDLDFGFTPATNLITIRRLGLVEEATAIVHSAWLDVDDDALRPLKQQYRRRTTASYAYACQRFNYADDLEVDAHGFVRVYPKLWQAEG